MKHDNTEVVELTQLEEKQVAAIMLVAGANAMAAQATTLGGKMFYRQMRELALKQAEDVGITKKQLLLSEDVVLTLPGREPAIEFYEKDIDMMRECVRKYDEANKADRCSDCDGDDCVGCEK